MGSLHDDFGLHSFKRIVAQLEDGRHAAIEIGPDGHVEIIAVWEEGEPQPQPSYTQSKAMGLEPAPSTPQSQLEQQTAQKMQQAGQPIPGQAPPAWAQPQSYDGPNAVTVTAVTAVSAMLESMRKVTDEIMGSAAPPKIAGVTYRDLTAPTPKTEPAFAQRNIPRDPVFQARLNNIMNDNQYDRRLRGRTRGKLDMTRLYKAQAGSSSVFTQKLARKNKQYNVALVIDQSGSMGAFIDSPLGVAATSAQFLAEHLDRIPGMNLRISGFAFYNRTYKEFDSKIDLKTITYRILYTDLEGTTNDIEALMKAYAALRRQIKGHNVLLYLTDGQPDNMTVSRKIIQDNQKVGTTVGIGIRHQVSQTPHRIRIDDLAELKPAIIGVLQKEIKRG